ncbi:MAG: hypothetical protein GYA23_08650, partial [Methanomicrobiales archaeon]|nr:hypothetical protein [Methanomicrobiales archaeon]
MDKRVRRILLLCAIVTLGLLVLLANVTFIQLLAILLVAGIVLPFLLGMVTVAEVREAWATFRDQTLKKNSFLKKLDDIKLFEKKPAAARPEIPQPKMPVKTDAGPASPKGST